MAYIFLSHSHSDKIFARKIAADFRNNGHSVWIDEAEINIGDSLIEKIRDGIDRVDFVCAILSNNSIYSPWVQRELDIASNREVDERRIVVLPILLEKVQLPGFLKGKRYGDFTDSERYDSSFEDLLRAVGGRLSDVSAEEGKVEGSEVEALKAALNHAKNHTQLLERAAERAERVAFRSKSEALRNKIIESNKAFPLHSPINNTYAFEIDGIQITLDYLLWALYKAELRGSHPLDYLLTLADRWPEAESMLEAYKEMVESR